MGPVDAFGLLSPYIFMQIISVQLKDCLSFAGLHQMKTLNEF